MHKAWAIVLAGLAATSLPSSAAPLPASSIEGTWDLFWETRKGPRRSGYFVFRQTGDRLVAEMHGKGVVKVRGSASDNTFRLSGTRMLVKYTVSGTWRGDDMEGAFKALSVERKFTGKRRP